MANSTEAVQLLGDILFQLVVQLLEVRVASQFVGIHALRIDTRGRVIRLSARYRDT